MAARLESAKDIAKFFNMYGTTLRPEAGNVLGDVIKAFGSYDEKRSYMDYFL